MASSSLPFHPYIQSLSEGFARGILPGEKAHERLSSYSRPPAHAAREQSEKVKEGAVLVLLYPGNNGELLSVLIQRPEYDGVHSGQIAFPGGRRERKDPSLEGTALREAKEEIGIDPDRIELIGELSEVYIPPSRYIVSPFVGITHERPEFIPEPAEVAATLEVPIDPFIGPHRIVEKRVRAGKDGVILKVPAYEWKGRTIWGATAMMMSELTMMLE